MIRANKIRTMVSPTGDEVRIAAWAPSWVPEDGPTDELLVLEDLISGYRSELSAEFFWDYLVTDKGFEWKDGIVKAVLELPAGPTEKILVSGAVAEAIMRLMEIWAERESYGVNA